MGRRAALAAAVVIATGTQVLAAKPKLQFWNLTGNTITRLELAPAGTGRFGPNQTANDKDGTVDNDERLAITGTTAGRYDIRFTDVTGRTCTVKDVEVKAEGIFDLGEPEAKDCTTAH